MKLYREYLHVLIEPYELSVLSSKLRARQEVMEMWISFPAQCDMCIVCN